MSTFYIYSGIQASGKTTAAKEHVAAAPSRIVRINRDDIRNMLGPYWIPERENLVTEMEDSIIEAALRNGMDIISDNMNLNPKTIDHYTTIVSKYPNYNIKREFFHISLDDAIKRDSLRANPIGEKVIKDTYKKYRTILIQNATSPKVNNHHRPAIIVDLDGTLSLNTSGRPFYGVESAAGIKTDMVNEGVAEIVRSMYKNYPIIIVTGREELPEIKEATEEWLLNNNIPYSDIYYRTPGDYSHQDEYKRKTYWNIISNIYSILFVIEDSQKAVKMYRNLGLTVLQPNEGFY